MRIKAATALLGFAVCTLPVLKLSASPAPAHDPRTTAKTLSQGLEVDGAGTFMFQYKDMFTRAKGSDRFLSYLNAEIWGKMGKAKLDFELRTDDVKVEKGEYAFGLNMTKDDEFSIVFWKGDEKISIPLETAMNDKRPIPYLTMSLMATEDGDTFVVEARCGPYVATADIMVPYLDEEEHEHGDGDHEGDGDG